MRYNHLILATLLLAGFSLSACERSLRADVKGGIPPTFRFYGDDLMHHFFVCPELPQDQRNEKNAIWQIAPDRKHNNKWPLDITYGVVPEGFTQITPRGGEPPPSLEADKRYTYHFVRGSGGGGGGFIIRDGKVVAD